MVLSLDKTGCLNFNRVQKYLLVCIYRMSTVFVLRDDAQALVDAPDSGKNAAFQTMIANASVDNGPNKISVFLDDLKAPSASVPAGTAADPAAAAGTTPPPAPPPTSGTAAAGTPSDPAGTAPPASPDPAGTAAAGTAATEEDMDKLYELFDTYKAHNLYETNGIFGQIFNFFRTVTTVEQIDRLIKLFTKTTDAERELVLNFLIEEDNKSEYNESKNKTNGKSLDTYIAFLEAKLGSTSVPPPPSPPPPPPPAPPPPPPTISGMTPDEQIQRIVRLATKNPAGRDGKTCKDRPASREPTTGRPISGIITSELNEDFIKKYSELPIQDYFTKSQKDKLNSITTMNTWLEDIEKKMIEFKYDEDCYKIKFWKFYVDDLTSLTSKQINGTTLNDFYQSIKKIKPDELDSAKEAFFVSWMRSIFREIKILHPSIPTIFTDDSIPIPSIPIYSSTKSLVIIHYFPGEDITKKEYYMKPENNGKYIYIITSAGSTIADSTNPLKTVYPNLFDEANMKSGTTLTQNPYNGESYIKKYYYQKYGLNNGFYKEVIDLIESQPIKATIVESGHSITKSYPAGSVFYIQNDVPIQDDIRIRGICHIKGIDFTGRSDQLKLKSYSYINTYYSKILRDLIASTTKDIVIHLTAVPDDEITYRAIAAAVDTHSTFASSGGSSIQFNLPMSIDDYNKYIAMGPPNESTQVDPAPDKPIETRIAIPTAKCGKIKGTGGTTINMLASLTPANVTLTGCDTRSKDGTIIIYGRKKDVNIIEAKVNELLGKISPPIFTPPRPPTSTPLTREKIAMAAYTKEMSDRQAKYDAAIKDPDPILDTILMSINTLTTNKERAMIKQIIKVYYYKNETIPENIFDTDIENRKKNKIMKLINLKLHPDRCLNRPFCELLFKKANPLVKDYCDHHRNTRQKYKDITTDIIKNYIYKECQFKTGDKVFVVSTQKFGTITSDPLNTPSCSEKSGTTYNITYEDSTKHSVNESDLFKYDPAIAAPSPSATKGGVRKTLKHPRQRVHAPKRKSLRSSRRTLATDRA